MLNVLGGACQAGLEKLAPDRTVDARETGKPLPHGGHPALALSCPTELSTPNLNPLGSPTQAHIQSRKKSPVAEHSVTSGRCLISFSLFRAYVCTRHSVWVILRVRLCIWTVAFSPLTLFCEQFTLLLDSPRKGHFNGRVIFHCTDCHNSRSHLSGL